jgi:hypothetical protein
MNPFLSPPHLLGLEIGLDVAPSGEIDSAQRSFF